MDYKHGKQKIPPLPKREKSIKTQEGWSVIAILGLYWSPYGEDLCIEI